MAKQNKVAVNLAQDFTDAEKEQARSNIGVVEVDRTPVSGSATSVDNIHFNQKSVQTTQIVANNTDLGSTVPLPSLNTDEGKVPVAYYRDGRGYFLLEQYKDSRLPDSSSSDVGKALVVDSHGTPTWDNVGGGSSISMAAFKTTKTINIPGGNSSMLTDTYKIYDLPAKTAVNMTVFVCDMDRYDLAMMGISIWCGSVHIAANSFTRGTYTSISHALPVCYYNNTESPIEIKIGFNGSFVQQAVNIEMMGFTITQGA